MDKSTNLKTLKIYWGYWMRHPWLFAGSLMLGPAFALQTIVTPLFIAKTIGELSRHGYASPKYILYSAISLLSGIALWYLADVFWLVRLHSRTMFAMHNDCLDQLIIQDYEFFADNFSGSLVTQANRFVRSYEQFHVTVFIEGLGLFTSVIIALVVMFIYSRPIGLLIGLLWLASIASVITLVIKRIPIRRIAVSKDSQQTGELADILTNTVTIKTFAAEEYEKQRYEHTNAQRRDRYTESWDVGIRNNTTVQVMAAMLQLALFLVGIRAVEHHTISIATYLLFQVYIIVIINSINKTSLMMRQIEGALGDSHEMTLLFDRVPKVLNTTKPEASRINEGHVAFEQIDFDYGQGQNSEALFSNFSLDIRPGQRVGLVGPSGGGKTTITKLLLRFMDVQSGAITIDGQDIRELRQDDLHHAISYVPQEPLLFHRTLYENISYGDLQASKADVIAASKQAHAHDFIAALPNGYDTLVGERGIKLSGGQRQRVAIARAILKNAPILVLDEATSALDSESEKYIQAALWELMKNKTSVVIAHRLSTIQHLDLIIVLDDGRIVEQGSHKELLARKGLYAKLWSHQSGGFIEE